MMVYHNGNEVLETEIYSYASEHAHDMASRSLVGHFFSEAKLTLNFFFKGEISCRWRHTGPEADFNRQRLFADQDLDVCLNE